MTPRVALRELRILSGADAGRVRAAFSAMLDVTDGTEPHLREVLRDVLAHPGGLARAQLAYGIGRGHGLARPRALALAVAVEYFHTASLLFDDMPMMDDAAERRGRPCPHVRHGEAAATLGALALIARAYALLWTAIDQAPAPTRVRATTLVAESLGVAGILNGQARDVHFLAARADHGAVLAIAEAKTAPLVRMSLVLPALVAGASAETLDVLERIAVSWGLAYQILDDFGDCLRGEAETGKSTRRDGALGRPNFVLRAGDTTARRQLARLLAESRGLVTTLTITAAGRWRVLSRLQRRLEAEQRDVRRRLSVDRSA
jgi:geranylgeranyl diphosphate synthase, type II